MGWRGGRPNARHHQGRLCARTLAGQSSPLKAGALGTEQLSARAGEGAQSGRRRGGGLLGALCRYPHQPSTLPPCRSCCWRRGPASKPILCNACGSRYLVKRSLDGYQPLQTRREQSAAREAVAGGAPKEPQRRAAPTAASGRTTKPKRAAQKRWVVPQLGVAWGWAGLGADFRRPLANPTNHRLSSTPLTTSSTLLPLLLQACRLRRLEQRP